MNTPPDDWHSACVVIEQLPVTEQQAPDGWEHGFGVHVPAWKAPEQDAWTTNVHVPPAAQHEPGWGHEFVGEQVPAWKVLPDPVQAA